MCALGRGVSPAMGFGLDGVLEERLGIGSLLQAVDLESPGRGRVLDESWISSLPAKPSRTQDNTLVWRGPMAEGPQLQRLDEDANFWTLYNKGETIGRGHFAKVKLVRHLKTNRYCAAKILDKRLDEYIDDYDAMIREFNLLASLRHQNIVRLYEAYESNKSLFLVCELATGGELMHRIADGKGLYTEDEARRHCKTLMGVVAFMHAQGVVHRDLKPENILLSDQTESARLLVADFGLGCFIAHAASTMETVCGTHHYLAPELVKCDRGELASYDKSIDIWGVGLICFMMLFGYNPFLRQSTLATHQAIVECKYTFPKKDNVSSEAKSMIKKMICLDRKKRISIEAALKHKWFSKLSKDSAGLQVGTSDVRSVMKEFNARRSILRMTNIRARARRQSEDLAEDAPKLAALLGIRRNSEDKGTPPQEARGELPRRRRNSNSNDTKKIVEHMRAAEINRRSNTED